MALRFTAVRLLGVSISPLFGTLANSRTATLATASIDWGEDRSGSHSVKATLASFDKCGSSWPRSSYRPNDPDQQTCADEPGDQVAQPSSQVDPKETKDGARNRRPDYAEHNI